MNEKTEQPDNKQPQAPTEKFVKCGAVAPENAMDRIISAVVLEAGGAQ